MATTYPRMRNTIDATINMPEVSADRGFEKHAVLRAVDTEMADGSVVTSYIATGIKWRYVLRWRLLTGTDRDTVTALFEDLSENDSRLFWPPNEDTSVSVTRDTGFYSIDWQPTVAAAGILWSGEMRLRQV